MADSSTRPGARLCASVVVFVALVAVPLGPTAASTVPRDDAVARWVAQGPDRFMHWAQRAAPRELVEALQIGDPGGRFILNLPWHDMTADGLDDVMAIDLDFGPDGLGLTGVSSKLIALNGRDGTALWSRDFEDQMVFPVEVTLGKKARGGALALVYDFETYATVFVGLDHRGRTFYEHAFPVETSVEDGEVFGSEDVVSFAVQDSLAGRADDVFVGIANVTRGPRVDPAVPSVVARTRTAAIDGKTGDLVEHAETELAVGRVPMPLAAPDLDGDGLDDHLIAYVLPDVEEDEESGLPVLPPVEGELVRGRRGTDGARLWTSPPLELAEGWDAPPLKTGVTLGDQTRDGHDEVLLSFEQHSYLSAGGEIVRPGPDQKGVWSLSGRKGDVLWARPVTHGLVIDSVDRDRRRDVVLVDNVQGKRSGTRLTVASGLDARRVYTKFFSVRRRNGQTVDSNVWPAGDLQPDGVDELILSQGLRRESANAGSYEWVRDVLLSGATGRNMRSLHDLSPMGASVDGHGDDLYRWPSSPAAVGVIDGRTRGPRLYLELDIPLTLPTDADYLIPIPARLDRDRCADFVGTLANSRSTFAVGIDGGSGRLVWAKRQQGLDLGGPAMQTKRLDRNRAC